MRRLSEKRHSVSFEVGDPVFLFENNGLKSDGMPYRATNTKDFKNRKSSLTKKLLYRFSGPHRIHSKIANNAYRIVDSRSGVVRDANVAYLKQYNPWDSNWEVDSDRICQEFEALEVSVLKNDICIVRFEQVEDTDPPWAVVKVLEKEKEGDLIVHYYGNYRGNIWGKHVPGWVDTSDNLHYYSKTKRKNSIPYTNRISNTKINVSDVAYSGTELKSDGSLGGELKKALQEDSSMKYPSISQAKRRRRNC